MHLYYSQNDLVSFTLALCVHIQEQLKEILIEEKSTPGKDM